MKELQKVVFPNLHLVSYNELIEIFASYAAYKLISDDVYKTFEKGFAKNISRTSVEQCLVILQGLQRTGHGTQQYFLLLDHKLLNLLP